MIRSESKALWDFITGLLKMPFLLVQKLFGGKAKPFGFFSDFFRFFSEPKATFTLVLVNTCVFFLVGLLHLDVSSLVWQSTDLFNGRFYTLFPSMFFHVNIWHLLGNMIFLYILGRVVERELGANGVLAIYSAAGIASFAVDSLFRVLFLGETVTAVGASGAISGLAAAALVLRPLYITWFFFGLPLPILVIVFLQIMKDVWGLFIPDNSGIGYLAHIAGYMTVVIGYPLFPKHRRRQMKKGFFIAVASILVLFLLPFFTRQLFGYFQGLL